MKLSNIASLLLQLWPWLRVPQMQRILLRRFP